ncbi:hypothetical protein DRO61_01860 [Candidatus Bathyarchaeota archaeon]|nr:MAG: hypothetical protein DRO61_01860 [Candidatus Bathyarchaeota archaeon]
MSFNEKLSENEKLLNAYEKSHGLPDLKSPGSDLELEEYLTMDRTVIEKLNSRSIWAISSRLSQFAFYIQRSLNRNKAIITYVNHELNKIIANEIGQYDKFTKHDVKVYQICKTNTAAVELLKIRLYAEQLVERFSELSNGIKNLSYVISIGSKIGKENE